MIFVDTSFWVALINQRDAHHAEALALLHRYGTDPLSTTNHVVGETWTFLGRRMGHAAAVRFLDMIDQSPRLQIVTVPPSLEEEALLWLRRHDEREYSFVDATSFALMRSLTIRDALAFDGDFSAAGFHELRVA
ncbi:MAG TPA: PIN domain-containing protein [Chloroflexota bacterium]|nr:PIN domain-containing protein [Chloroflexota bacterium]